MMMKDDDDDEDDDDDVHNDNDKRDVLMVLKMIKHIDVNKNDDNYGPRRNGVVYKMGVTLVTIGQFWLVVPVGQKVVVAI